ncbi:MAG: spore germination protein [Clostridiales bacterium]|nr:spore germination protein [Clostridiales bacterium]
MKLSSDLSKNLEEISKILSSDDFIFFNFTVCSKQALAIYAEDLSDKEAIGKQAVFPLQNLTKFESFKDFLTAINVPESQTLTTVSDCVDKVLAGDGVILIDGEIKGVSVATKKPASRAVTEPPTASILKGPREGFVENAQVNMSLVRQRLKTPLLKYEKLSVGKFSKTMVGLAYIKGVANDKVVNTLRDKINKISVDGVIDSSYIIKSITDRKTSMFKQVGSTEKPDIFCAKLLEGRVGILVDGSPIALTAPFILLEDFQSSEDYYINTYRANFSRILRLIAVMISILLPAFFVASQLFHLQFIPLSFLLTIVGSIKGIPLSPSVEMFVTLLIFEILNEASIRMPRYVGIAMSVVGALVLGETAVNAGMVSTPTIMIIALSGICFYAVPDLNETLSVLRLMFLTIAGFMGGYGIILLGCGVITYLCAYESFETPYLSPYSPLSKRDLQDGFIMSFYSEQTMRPSFIKGKNKRRKNFANG